MNQSSQHTFDENFWYFIFTHTHTQKNKCLSFFCFSRFLISSLNFFLSFTFLSSFRSKFTELNEWTTTLTLIVALVLIETCRVLFFSIHNGYSNDSKMVLFSSIIWVIRWKFSVSFDVFIKNFDSINESLCHCQFFSNFSLARAVSLTLGSFVLMKKTISVHKNFDFFTMKSFNNSDSSSISRSKLFELLFQPSVRLTQFIFVIRLQNL